MRTLNNKECVEATEFGQPPEDLTPRIRMFLNGDVICKLGGGGVGWLAKQGPALWCEDRTE